MLCYCENDFDMRLDFLFVIFFDSSCIICDFMKFIYVF